MTPYPEGCTSFRTDLRFHIRPDHLIDVNRRPRKTGVIKADPRCWGPAGGMSIHTLQAVQTHFMLQDCYLY